jgi:hypothetical protein
MNLHDLQAVLHFIIFPRHRRPLAGTGRAVVLSFAEREQSLSQTVLPGQCLGGEEVD